MADTTRSAGSPAPLEQRRGFFMRFAAGAVGALLFVCPALAGLAVIFDPLRRKSGGAQLLRVTTFDALPSDGQPRRFPVVANRTDAWTLFPPEPIGAVYLRRVEGPQRVEAFNVVCPHLGCSVGFSGAQKEFQCPCHTSAFALDGAVISGPSPRGMDTLTCQIKSVEGREEVWVEFENFYTGRTEKTPKA